MGEGLVEYAGFLGIIFGVVVYIWKKRKNSDGGDRVGK